MAAVPESEFKLKIMEKPLVVQTCSHDFNQPVDVRGRPSAGVRSGLIRISILGDDHGALTNWAVDPLMALDGTIIMRDTIGAVFMTLRFEDTYCVRYHEVFTPGSTISAYRFELGLTARRLYMDATYHDSQWLDWNPRK